MSAAMILFIVTFAALVAALGYIWWLHRVIDGMSGSHARPRECGPVPALPAPESVPPLTSGPQVVREEAGGSPWDDKAEPVPDSLEWHAETAAAEHANKMWQASAPYLPDLPPIRIDRPAVRREVPGHPPWTGSQDVLTEDDIIERDRQRVIRAELEALGDDPTESGVGRVMAMARALPAPTTAGPELAKGLLS